MVIATEQGTFKDRFEMLSAPFQQEAENEGREQVPLYRGGKDVTPKERPPIIPTAPQGRRAELEPESSEKEQDLMSKREDIHAGQGAKPKEEYSPEKGMPIVPGSKGDKGLQVDRDHHVPLLASATMDDAGNMNGLAIDHRANLSRQDEELIHLHEATELPYMNDLVKGGMKPSDAYAKAHAHATERETAASIARWGQDGHEAYQGRIREAVSRASQPSDRDRHPDAHTTRYALDESELGHKPMQIDVLGQGTAMHSGPGPFRRPSEHVGKEEPANINKPKSEETDADAMLKIYHNNPDLYKYYRAMWQQKGGKEWERWQDIEEDMGITPQEFKVLPKFKTIKGGKDE